MSGSQIWQSSSRTLWKSPPPLELNAPGTFSHIAICGYLPLVADLISFMILTASRKSTDSSPSKPLRFPAIERFWQGDPKVITSTGSISAPFIFVMSPRCFMPGNRLEVTATGNGSISLAHTGKMPTIDAASGQVPEPSNKLPSFISSLRAASIPHAECT